MLFNTVQYLIFLPIVVLIYYVLPPKVRYLWLLAASYYFYMQWNPVYILLLFTATAITFVGGRIIENIKTKVKAAETEAEADKYKASMKRVLVICLLICLGILGVYKYADFAVECLNLLLRPLHRTVEYRFDILLPVGISFYTLQSLGYLIDVYRDDIYAERNFLKYALFVSFFPQLVAGPIERSKNLLVQLQTPHKFEWDNFKKGMLLVLYGMFLKIVIADRAAMIVKTVFADTATYSGFYIIVAASFFSFEIYCDFYGYSTIAKGTALMMGYHLMDNFNAPYFSLGVQEFWRRWHISLCTWLRDYLYFPLGGSRKGRVRKEVNFLIIFAISGLWHGPSFAYICWGFLSGLFQVIADVYQAILKKFGIVRKAPNFGKRFFLRIWTFILITFAGIFFCAGDMPTSLAVMKNLTRLDNWTIFFNGSLFNLGVARNYMLVLILSIVVLMLVDYIKYKGRDAAELVLSQNLLFQLFVVVTLVFVILLYGVYGTIYDVNQFVYFQF